MLKMVRGLLYLLTLLLLEVSMLVELRGQAPELGGILIGSS